MGAQLFDGYRVRRAAGQSAMREYERRKKQWQRRNRRLFRGMAVAVVIIFLGTSLAAQHHLWPYVGGMLAGAAVSFYIAVHESPPAWIENYLVGAHGEELTAKALTPLFKWGWVVVHDLNRIKSNLDHVLVGPGGVFVLDTKNLHGTVVVDGDRLTLTRPGEARAAYANDNLAGQARAQGSELNRMLKQRCQLSPWVTAVVVVWAEIPQQIGHGRSMSYVHGDHLVNWLQSQPARLNAKQIEQIASALKPGQRRRSKRDTQTDPANETTLAT